jgi:hypothetical protein
MPEWLYCELKEALQNTPENIENLITIIMAVGIAKNEEDHFLRFHIQRMHESVNMLHGRDIYTGILSHDALLAEYSILSDPHGRIMTEKKANSVFDIAARKFPEAMSLCKIASYYEY